MTQEAARTRTYYRHSSVTEEAENFDKPTAGDLGTATCFFCLSFSILQPFDLKFSVLLDA